MKETTKTIITSALTALLISIATGNIVVAGAAIIATAYCFITDREFRRSF